MKILFLEPFFGGSHKEFCLGLQAHSRHEVTLVSLPARFWKWRMRGAALYFADKIRDFSSYDVIITSDMMDLTDFKALAGKSCPPVVLYFHENQLSYPLTRDEKQDFHLGFTNIISAFAADQVIFNSMFHMDEFLGAARQLIRRMPDAKPGFMVDGIMKKALVLYPGCRFEAGHLILEDRDLTKPLIIWNHRWEHDKNPELFFDTLLRLKEKHIPFSLAVMGESFDAVPDVFRQAEKALKEEILVFGYVGSRQEYLAWLKKGALSVSTAFQENFGISVVEAVRHGCIPLLPTRLSYPEIMPREFHSRVLYQTDEELFQKLCDMVTRYPDYIPIQKPLSLAMARYSWQAMASAYDHLFDQL